MAETIEQKFIEIQDKYYQCKDKNYEYFLTNEFKQLADDFYFVTISDIISSKMKYFKKNIDEKSEQPLNNNQKINSDQSLNVDEKKYLEQQLNINKKRKQGGVTPWLKPVTGKHETSTIQEIMFKQWFKSINKDNLEKFSGTKYHTKCVTDFINDVKYFLRNNSDFGINLKNEDVLEQKMEEFEKIFIKYYIAFFELIDKTLEEYSILIALFRIQFDLLYVNISLLPIIESFKNDIIRAIFYVLYFKLIKEYLKNDAIYDNEDLRELFSLNEQIIPGISRYDLKTKKSVNIFEIHGICHLHSFILTVYFKNPSILQDIIISFISQHILKKKYGNWNPFIARNKTIINIENPLYIMWILSIILSKDGNIFSYDSDRQYEIDLLNGELNVYQMEDICYHQCEVIKKELIYETGNASSARYKFTTKTKNYNNKLDCELFENDYLFSVMTNKKIVHSGNHVMGLCQIAQNTYQLIDPNVSLGNYENMRNSFFAINLKKENEDFFTFNLPSDPNISTYISSIDEKTDTTDNELINISNVIFEPIYRILLNNFDNKYVLKKIYNYKINILKSLSPEHEIILVKNYGDYLQYKCRSKIDFSNVFKIDTLNGINQLSFIILKSKSFYYVYLGFNVLYCLDDQEFYKMTYEKNNDKIINIYYTPINLRREDLSFNKEDLDSLEDYLDIYFWKIANEYQFKGGLNLKYVLIRIVALILIIMIIILIVIIIIKTVFNYPIT